MSNEQTSFFSFHPTSKEFVLDWLSIFDVEGFSLTNYFNESHKSFEYDLKEYKETDIGLIEWENSEILFCISNIENKLVCTIYWSGNYILDSIVSALCFCCGLGNFDEKFRNIGLKFLCQTGTAWGIREASMARKSFEYHRVEGCFKVTLEAERMELTMILILSTENGSLDLINYIIEDLKTRFSVYIIYDYTI